MDNNEKSRKLTSINLENEYIVLCDKLCEKLGLKRAQLIKLALEYINKNNIDIRYDNIELSPLEKIAQKYETAIISAQDAEKQKEQFLQLAGLLTQSIKEIKENKNLLVSPNEMIKQQIEERTRAEEELKMLQEKIKLAKRTLTSIKRDISNAINIFD